MAVEDSGRGYDLPIQRKEEDFFDRWLFASELWQIVGKAPQDWSVRVGVYGRWGEGKTSVLNFLQHFARRDGDITVWFNPWSVRDRDELWNRFAGAIFGRLEEEGIKVEGGATVKIKKVGRLIKDPIQKAAEFNQSSKAIIGGALTLVGKLLNASSSVFKHIHKALGSRRVIVVIDDLDRTDPKLLPELFLSLRDVLDLPGFSFVLAFDVDIVARALTEQYTAWGRGEEFLEKIIDFPLSLPTPSDHQLRKFLFTQIERDCSFVSRTVLEDLFSLLPKNPRKLKLFVRHVWTLRNQVSRHDQWELDWPTLLIWQLLKMESASFCKLFTEDDEFVSDLTTGRLRRRLEDVDERNKGDGVIRQRVTAWLKALTIDSNDPRATRIQKLVEALAGNTSSNSPEHLRYQLHIIDRPHAITWKEFAQAFATWCTTHNIEEIDKWLSKHSTAVEADVSNSALDLFDNAINFRLRKLDDAAGALGADDHGVHMGASSQALDLIADLVQNGLKSVGTQFYQTARNFGAVWEMTKKWIHFRNNELDKTAREQERRVLLQFAKIGSIDPISFLEIVKPWVDENDPLGRRGLLINQLRAELAAEVEPLVADRVLIRLQERGTIASLWEANSHVPDKWILFNSTSPLWSKDRRRNMIELLGQAHVNTTVHGNAVELIQIISQAANEGGVGIPYVADKLKKLLADKEISGAIWKAATARPLQYRSLSNMREIRQQFIKICGSAEHLPVPEWLEAEK